eukprot:3468803-Prymnesium_polylepis.1
MAVGSLSTVWPMSVKEPKSTPVRPSASSCSCLEAACFSRAMRSSSMIACSGPSTSSKESLET